MTAHEAETLQAVVLVDVGIVLIVGAALLRLSRLARQPAVVGEILAGVALGPSILGLLPWDLPGRLFPAEGRPFLSVIAQVGLLLFMFVLGWEMDPGRLRRSKGAVAGVTAGSIALPFGLGVLAAVVCYGSHSVVAGKPVDFLTFALYLGIAMSVTAFPVLARIISDGGLGSTAVGSLALASAALGDLVAWCLLAIVIGLATAGGIGGFAAIVLWSAVYMLGMFLVVRPLLARLAARLIARGSTTQLVSLVAAGVLVSSFATSSIGIHPIFGAFVFGLVMPRLSAEELGSAVRRPIEDAARLLLPVYFIVTGLSVDVGSLHGRDWLDLALLLAVACVGKVFGATLPARWTGMGWRESVGVGVLMNTRGLTELIILNVGLSLGVLDGRLFTVMVLVALLTTAAAGPLLPLLVKPHPDFLAEGRSRAAAAGAPRRW